MHLRFLHFKVLLFSILIGMISGCIVSIFAYGLTFTQQIFQPIYLCVLCIAAVCITWLLQKYPDCANGMKKVFQNGQGTPIPLPKKMILMTIVTTWLTHAFGGSAGREGVGVQLGAISAYQISKHTTLLPKKDWIPIGMAAGFAALFQTPIAATVFALEVLHKGRFKVHLLLPTLCSSYTAKYVSSFLYTQHTTYTAPILNQSISFIQLVILGVCFGCIGMLFAYGLHQVKSYFTVWRMNIYYKTFFCALCLAILLYIFHGRYSGLGTNLIQDAFSHGFIFAYDWIFKLCFTLVTLGIGLQGGEVTPLFSIGTCFGVWIAPYIGLPSVFCACLGYCAVFSAATKTILAPICIGLELFETSYFPYLCIVCAIAYTFSRYSIYSQEID